MYKNVDVVDIAIKSSIESGEVARDRNIYAPFFKVVEQYIYDHELVIGGNIANLMLLNKKLGPQDYAYEIYSKNTLTDAREITNLCYQLDPKGLGRYANMQTIEPYKEFIINVDERALFTIKGLDKYCGIFIIDIIKPVKRPAFFLDLELLCINTDLQLIDTYASLTSCHKAGEWHNLVDTEQQLRSLFIKEKKGGGVVKDFYKRGNLQPFIDKLLKEFVPRMGHILIGGYAINLYNNRDTKSRLQIITSNTFTAEENTIQTIAKSFGYRVSSTISDPKIPSIPLLRKLTVYVVRSNNTKEAFIDIYNSGDYELIPSTIKLKTTIGTPFIIMRFLLIDIWTMRLLSHINAIKEKEAAQITQKAMQLYLSCVEIYDKMLKNSEFTSICPIKSANYIGRYLDIVKYTKRQRFNQQPGEKKIFHLPYYPLKNE